MLLMPTELVRAAGGHGGPDQAGDFLMVNGVTTLAACPRVTSVLGRP